MRCSRCGKASIIPTSSGFWDDLCSLFGRVRYRCISCRHKEVKQLWSFADNRYVHCPNCFSANLQRWSPTFLPRTFRRSILRRLGGRCYRCVDCSHAFTSLRSAKPLLRYIQEGSEGSMDPEECSERAHALATAQRTSTAQRMADTQRGVPGASDSKKPPA